MRAGRFAEEVTGKRDAAKAIKKGRGLHTRVPEIRKALPDNALVIRKLEAAGIEPSDDFAATKDGVCNCENCQQCRAAYALHLECFKGHLLASFDADLQRVIAVWDELPEAMRRAALAIMGLNG